MEKNESSSAPTASRDGINRLGIGANVVLQILIVAAIVAGLNYLGFKKKPLRWDLSRNSKFQLSPMTKNLLQTLRKPVTVIVFTSGSPIQQELQSLLREYEFAAAKNFQVEYVNPFTNVGRAREIVTQYKLNVADNVVFDYGGKTKVVNLIDMAVLDQSGIMSGQAPTVKSFKGEQVITSTLIELSEDKQGKLYLVTGHGEMSLGSEDAADFAAFAERQNLKLEALNLSNVDVVPADATGLMIFGPTTDLSERDVQMLAEYWAKNGRIFLLVGPEAKTPRLNDWLARQGIRLKGDTVISTQRVPVRDPDTGDISLVTGVVISPPGVFLDGNALTKGLENINALFLGRTQSIEIDAASAKAQHVDAFPIINSVKDYWGDSEFTGDMREPARFDPGKDRQGPFPIAVAAEKGGLGDPRVQVDTARLVVAGNARWLSSEGLKKSSSGEDFAVNAINWLLKREQLVGIAPKPKQALMLNLDEGQLGLLVAAIFIVVPGFVFLAGINVWARRSDINLIVVNAIILAGFLGLWGGVAILTRILARLFPV